MTENSPLTEAERKVLITQIGRTMRQFQAETRIVDEIITPLLVRRKVRYWQPDPPGRSDWPEPLVQAWTALKAAQSMDLRRMPLNGERIKYQVGLLRERAEEVFDHLWHDLYRARPEIAEPETEKLGDA